MILNCPSCNARYNVDPTKLGPAGRRVRCASCGHIWRQQPITDETADPGVAQQGQTPPPGGDEGRGGKRYQDRTQDQPVQPSETGSQRMSAGDAGSYREPYGGREAYAGGYHASSSTGASTGALAGRTLDKPARRGGGAAILLWILVLGSVAVAALYLGRDHVVDTWPPSYGIYQQLGVDVATPTIAGPGLTVRRVTSERLDGEGQSPPRLVVTGELVNDSDFVRSTPRLMATLFDSADRALFDWSFGVERERLEPGESIRFATALDNPDDSATRLEITVADN